jgi:hypothetical protein
MMFLIMLMNVAKPGWRILNMMRMENLVSKYTNLLDRIIEVAEEYRHWSHDATFSEETQEYFSQVADELESIVEDEADE